MSRYTYKDGLKDGIPIALGYFMVSIGFGISAVNRSLSVITSVLISITNLTSAGQVAGLEILTSKEAAILASSALEMFLTQLVINLRYSLMGISLSQKLDSSFTTAGRMLTGYFITDEIYAMASSKKGNICVKYMLGLATLPFFGWAGGTLTGAAAASIMPAEISNIFGIAIYGMFISIVVPDCKGNKGVLLCAILSAALSCLICYIPALSFISSGFRIIICALAVSMIVAAFYPAPEEKEEENE